MQKTAQTSLARRRQRFKTAEPYIWLFPSALLLLIMVFLPIGQTIWMSLTEISKAAIIKSFNGFENYAKIFSSPVFGKVISNTLIWTVATVGISTLIGYALALSLNQQFVGRKVARTILIFPWATALAVTASMWDYMYNFEYGSLNALLNVVGLPAVNWLKSAQTTFPAMIVVAIVVTVPFTTFCLLSGLQTISKDYYESASIDGAGPWKRMVHITIPCLKPAFNTSIVLNVIYVFNSFPIVWTIAKQSSYAHQADTITAYLYFLGFRDLRYGRAAAVSVVGFMMLLIFALIYMHFTMKNEVEL